MTCIVGVKQAGEVWLGGDSMGHNGHTAVTMKDGKLFTRSYAGGKAVFGFCGSVRYGHLLRYAMTLPPLPSNREELHRWVSLDLVDAIRKAASEHGAQQKKDELEEALGQSWFLLGIAGKLFAVQGNYQVVESALDYGAVGSGDETALGAMYAMRSYGLQPQEFLRVALEAAAEHTPHVRPPFHYVST